MSEPSCPKCGSQFLVVERRPDGNAKCACGWHGKYERCFEAPKKRECVTHHHACECREEKFKQLEAQIKEANEVAEFYGGTDCYAVVTADGQVDGFSEEEPGQRARAYLKKWEKT